MTTRKTLSLFVPSALLLLLAGCEVIPVTAQVEDTRLDQIVSSLDKTLANQAEVNTQLQQQQRQLDLTQQQLKLMSQGVDAVLKDAIEDSCPRLEACPAPKNVSGKMLVGALEEIWLPDLGMALTARIDTGAKTSSIDASNIKLFERDGKRWVSFQIFDPESGEPVSLERRHKRTVGIIQPGSQQAKSRPVVKMSIIIGSLEQIAEFSLSSRTHAGYQVLIGRSILKDVMLVDVSSENIAPHLHSLATPVNTDKAK